MRPTAIFYGSATGQTREAALKIADALGIDRNKVYDVATTEPSIVGSYDNLILGSSTWGAGELEDSWYDFILGLEAMDLKGKKIALFGCGDTSMDSTFCDAVGILHDRLTTTGATFIGEGFTTEGLTFSSSRAVRDGKALGLLLDDVNHAILTDERIAAWAASLKPQL
ncbi:MAG: flavodoxin [Pseudoflavonifractor sp.]|nr:flavodoxin [Alloprevotella sp.]MCM1117142.1 flavodoxin [Pseudoflavonifractor sp.]